MQRSRLWVASAVWLSTLFLIGLGLATSAAQAAPAASLTPVCGAISANTTWTTANSPYEVCGNGVTVNAGKTLTVQPGVTVQFLPGLSPQLLVRGQVFALGTLEQPITFTAVVTQHVPGAWWGITADSLVITPAVVNLNQVILDYGGANVSYGAQLLTDHATLTVTQSLLRNGLKAGIWGTGYGSVTVAGTAFSNNGGQAMHLIQPVAGLELSGLSAAGNGLNGIYVQGTTALHGQRHWPAAGVPYIVDGLISNLVGDALTIDPGAELQFLSTGYLSISGNLKAIGLPGAPITLTGQTKSPGFWNGLVVYGGSQPANAQLDYVTLEYGGRDINGANLTIDGGYVVAHNAIIRFSSKDGVRLNSAAHAAILNSQIISNTLYGVRNTQITRAMLATNNWWGDPAGPTADVPSCSPGHGSKVTSGVLFRPVLTSTTATNLLPLSSAPILTLTPRRWFAPADNITRMYFDITLMDGNGAPLPGRTVKLSSSLGVATDGGITDAEGHTLAYLVSHTPGDADVTAALDVTGCEGALSPTSRVTFNPPINILNLFPDSPASYFDGRITVSPQPVLVGVPTLISAKLTNPYTVPITVDVSFGISQSGIGLTFGPIHDFNSQVIPANSSITLSASWLPPISGHYCILVSYALTGVGSGLSLPSGPSSGSVPNNINVYQGGTGPSNKPGQLDKTRNALDVLSGFFGNAFDTNHLTVQSAIVDKGIAWQLNTAETISGALGGDPPRQDFQQLTSPHILKLAPVPAGGGLSAARAQALNALNDALAEVNADGRAIEIAFDRTGGASEAGNLQWASLQAAAVLHYDQVMGQALITASNRIDDLLNVAASEGVTQVVISTSDVISFQQHLASGWSAQEISDAHAVGLSDAELENLRQRYLHDDESPKELTGDGLQNLRDLRDRFLVLAEILINPVAFQPRYGVTGGAGLQAPDEAAAPATGNTLVQLSTMTATVQLGNPLSATATIDLRARRIDLPADWAVSVSPGQVVNLAPGAQTTITVTIVPGSPLPQGSLPRVAVEGYVGSQLLGGVVVQLVAPNYVFFDGHLHVYLPLTRR